LTSLAMRSLKKRNWSSFMPETLSMQQVMQLWCETQNAQGCVGSDNIPCSPDSMGMRRMRKLLLSSENWQAWRSVTSTLSHPSACHPIPATPSQSPFYL
jgi:hypothetical protein